MVLGDCRFREASLTPECGRGVTLNHIRPLGCAQLSERTKQVEGEAFVNVGGLAGGRAPHAVKSAVAGQGICSVFMDSRSPGLEGSSRLR